MRSGRQNRTEPLRLALLLAMLALAAPSALQAEPGLPGTGDGTDFPWSCETPESAFPGDCLAVSFTSGFPFFRAYIALIDPSGAILARAEGFSAGAAGPAAAHRFIALLPLDSRLAPGDYSLEASLVPADGSPALCRETPLVLGSRSFAGEDILLDARNTAIRTDASPLRLEQTRRLSAILDTRDPASPRFFGPWAAPLASLRRSAGFGDRRNWRYSTGKGETSLHYGIDFPVPSGTPVFASGDGTVVMAENRISTGFTVVIEHLPGVYSLYYHLDALLAGEGETVRTGSLIGRSGNTGLATGPHLHWEFRVNGEAADPDWFTGRVIR